MLVERIRRSGVIPHRIDVSHSIALSEAIHIARPLAEPEVHFIRFAFQIVVGTLILPTKIIALRRPIRRGRLPSPVLHHLPLAEEALQFNG
jgi:hypothetical protein